MNICLCPLYLSTFSSSIEKRSENVLYIFEKPIFYINKKRTNWALKHFRDKILRKNYDGYVIRTTNGKFFSLSHKKKRFFLRKRRYVPVFLNESDAREYADDLINYKPRFCSGIEVCQINVASLYRYKQKSNTKFQLIENLQDTFSGRKYYKIQPWLYTVSIKLYKSHLIKIVLFNTNHEALQFLDFYNKNFTNQNDTFIVKPSDLILPLQDGRRTAYRMIESGIYAFPLKSCVIHWETNRNQIENKIRLGETIIVFAEDLISFSIKSSQNIKSSIEKVVIHTGTLSSNNTSSRLFQVYYFTKLTSRKAVNQLSTVAKTSLHFISEVFQKYCDRVHSRVNLLKIVGIILTTRYPR